MADEKDNFQADFIYILEIDVKKGIDLKSADMNGKSDPYVNVFCGNRKFQTIIQKKTLNPEWNAQAHMYFYRQPEEVKFIVKDWDQVGKPDPLGDYTLSLAGMFRDGAKPFEGCVKLEHVKTGQIDIKVSCKKISPVKLLVTWEKLKAECKENENMIQKKKQDYANATQTSQTIQKEYSEAQGKRDTARTECNSVREECEGYQTQGYRMDEQIRSLEQECRDLETKKAGIKAQYKATKSELERCRGDAGKAEERRHRIMDSQGNVDEERLKIYTRIQKYNAQFMKGDNDSVEEYEIDISKEIVIGYAKKTREAQGYAAEDDKEAECERANNQAAKYLEQIREWSRSIDKQLERAKDRYMVELDITESNDIDFFYPFFKALCKFFFNTQIVAATIEQFGDEIKKKTKKNPKKMTFYDLWSKKENNSTGGNDEEDEDNFDDDNVDEETRSAWNNIYSDLDFVMEELNTLLSKTVKNKPIMTLCNNARNFMEVYYNGNYPKFSANVAYWTCTFISDPEDNPDDMIQANHMTEDALGAIVSLYSDKKEFPKKLFLSIEKARQKGDEQSDESDDDDNDEDDEDDTKCSEDAFEMIMGRIVLSIATIIDKISSDLLTEGDKKIIKAQRDLVVDKANVLNIDAASQKLIENFYDYFFDPKGSGGCCDCGGGDEGGIMGFFGSIFGMCK